MEWKIFVALLVLVVPAQADMLQLQDGREFTGTCVEKNAEVVKFDLRLFKMTAEGPRALRLTVPMALVREVTRDEAGVKERVTRPVGSASAEEKVKAAGKFLALGVLGERENLSVAAQLFSEVFEANQARLIREQPQLKTEDAADIAARTAVEGVLRFRLADWVDEVVKAKPAELAALMTEMAKYQQGYRVVVEFVSYLTLVVTLELDPKSPQRKAVLAELQAALKKLREAYLKKVADAAASQARSPGVWTVEKLAQYQAEIDRQLRSLRALVYSPGSAEGLLNASRLKPWVERLNGVMAGIGRWSETARNLVETPVMDLMGQWRSRVLPDDVMAVVDGVKDASGMSPRELSKILYEQNQQSLATASAECRGLFNAINEYREMLGLMGLVYHPTLTKAAQNQASRCQQALRADHGLGGKLADRLNALGYTNNVIGENLYKSPEANPTASEVLKAWQGSPQHHHNLLRIEFRSLGVGKSSQYWAVIFGGTAR